MNDHSVGDCPMNSLQKEPRLLTQLRDSQTDVPAKIPVNCNALQQNPITHPTGELKWKSQI